MIYAYLRVSTAKQDLGRQRMELNKLNIKFDKVYEDKFTGTKKDRPKLFRMLLKVKAGDIVYCHEVSRLSRNVEELLEIVGTLVAKEVRLIIVKEGIDTDSDNYESLIKTYGALAEQEAKWISNRVIQGVECCKLKGTTKTGKWFGRPKITKEDLSDDFIKYYKQMKLGNITKVEMTKLLDCSRNTVYRWIKIYEDIRV